MCRPILCSPFSFISPRPLPCDVLVGCGAEERWRGAFGAWCCRGSGSGAEPSGAMAVWSWHPGGTAFPFPSKVNRSGQHCWQQLSPAGPRGSQQCWKEHSRAVEKLQWLAGRPPHCEAMLEVAALSSAQNWTQQRGRVTLTWMTRPPGSYQCFTLFSGWGTGNGSHWN